METLEKHRHTQLEFLNERHIHMNRHSVNNFEVSLSCEKVWAGFVSMSQVLQEWAVVSASLLAIWWKSLNMWISTIGIREREAVAWSIQTGRILRVGLLRVT